MRSLCTHNEERSSASYYGYRHYNPSLGRWISRDPSAERAGVDLYGFVHNRAICGVDKLGLSVFEREWADPECSSYRHSGRTRWVAIEEPGLDMQSGKWTGKGIALPNLEYTLSAGLAIELARIIADPIIPERVLPAQVICYCFKRNVTECAKAKEEVCLESFFWSSTGGMSWFPTGRVAPRVRRVFDLQHFPVDVYEKIFAGAEEEVDEAMREWLAKRQEECAQSCLALKKLNKQSTSIVYEAPPKAKDTRKEDAAASIVKRKQIVLSVVLGVTVTSVALFAVSASVASSRAGKLMGPSLRMGWQHSSTRFVFSHDGRRVAGWLVTYEHIGGIPAEYGPKYHISLFGRLVGTSLGTPDSYDHTMFPMGEDKGRGMPPAEQSCRGFLDTDIS